MKTPINRNGIYAPFTLIEALIVGVIVMIVAAVTMPMLSRIPHRIEVEGALTGIRQAFTETAMRARATGVPLSLTLDTERGVWLVDRLDEELPAAAVQWTPSVPADEDRETARFRALSSRTDYELSSGIEWLTDDSESEEVTFLFFEDGQAAGTPIRFGLGGMLYELRVDALSGDALIEEVERQ